MSLPIPDFDHLPLGSVADRIRALDLDQLDELIAHEHAHGDRLPVLEIMRSRREQLEQGAEPSSGGQDVHPETSSTSHGSPSTRRRPPSRGRPTATACARSPGAADRPPDEADRTGPPRPCAEGQSPRRIRQASVTSSVSRGTSTSSSRTITSGACS